MGSTYLALTNRVIRKINEVELTDTSFASARGMQALCKDAVTDAISEINQQRWEWPYHAVVGSQLLTVGVNEYSWPVDYKSVDWDSFYIEKDDTLETGTQRLSPVVLDEWFKYRRDIDYDNATDGSQKPSYVFPTKNGGFGVTPNPDKAYTVKFNYFKNPTVLDLYNDTTDIPTQFDNVITWGALYHMNLFRENVEGTGIAKTNFKEGISNMYSILVKASPDYVHDTRVNFGGNVVMNSDSGAYHL